MCVYAFLSHFSFVNHFYCLEFSRKIWKERGIWVIFCLTPKMAPLCCNNQEKNYCFTNNSRCKKSCSKAQACLKKILHLISTVPPPCEINSNPFSNRGFDIDLNLRFASFLDDDEEKSAAASAADVSSDVTDVQNSGTDGEVKTTKAVAFSDSFDLLVEAAEMISYRDCYLNEKKKEVEKSGGGTGSMEREKDRMVNVVIEEEEVFEEFEEIAGPVVRSKRGRSQVLPLRFRDSVLEPWKKRPQRSTAATVVSNKKRKPR